ncbi:hypothetical protein MesoLj131a_52990 [Mesorhizobium sp. 131-2-1]|nr:hypothetical protein MesoLj131a_52990 [Mesorhizobium sp. 131-2-1]
MEAKRYIANYFMEFLWRISPDHRDQGRKRSNFRPETKLAEPDGVQAALFFLVERVPHKILNGAEHRGNQLRVFAGCVFGRYMGDQKPGTAADEKDMLYAIDKRMLKNNLREAYSSSPSFKSPLKSMPGKYMS